MPRDLRGGIDGLDTLKGVVSGKSDFGKDDISCFHSWWEGLRSRAKEREAMLAEIEALKVRFILVY